MRILPLSLAISAALVPAAFGQAATIGERDVSRPGGAYMSTPAESAAACASQCAGDGLCMAWDYAAATQICELKAVTPAPRAATGFVSGLSARAPAFARAMSIPTPAAPPVAAAAAVPDAAPGAQPVMVAAAAPQTALAASISTQPVSPTPPPAGDTVGEELLGGPEPAAGDAGLRPRSAP